MERHFWCRGYYVDTVGRNEKLNIKNQTEEDYMADQISFKEYMDPFTGTKGGYMQKDVEKLILSMPFKRFEGMGYMRHSKYLGIVQIDRSIMKTLDEEDISTILTYCTDALERYWK